MEDGEAKRESLNGDRKGGGREGGRERPGVRVLKHGWMDGNDQRQICSVYPIVRQKEKVERDTPTHTTTKRVNVREEGTRAHIH